MADKHWQVVASRAQGRQIYGEGTQPVVQICPEPPVVEPGLPGIGSWSHGLVRIGRHIMIADRQRQIHVIRSSPNRSSRAADSITLKCFAQQDFGDQAVVRDGGVVPDFLSRRSLRCHSGTELTRGTHHAPGGNLFSVIAGVPPAWQKCDHLIERSVPQAAGHSSCQCSTRPFLTFFHWRETILSTGLWSL
jgi:hypothetical protein